MKKPYSFILVVGQLEVLCAAAAAGGGGSLDQIGNFQVDVSRECIVNIAAAAAGVDGVGSILVHTNGRYLN